MATVLKAPEYHAEVEVLAKDKILIQMEAELPKEVSLDEIPFKVIASEYEKRGGKHQSLTIGSLKEGLRKIRGEG
jgi:hypothetical protein